MRYDVGFFSVLKFECGYSNMCFMCPGQMNDPNHLEFDLCRMDLRELPTWPLQFHYRLFSFTGISSKLNKQMHTVVIFVSNDYLMVFKAT